MTTPERFRQRQRLEGTALMVLGLMLVASSYWFHHQDGEQRTCLGDNFSDLSAALNARADFAKKDARASKIEASAIRLESSANNTFYRAAFAASSQAEVLGAYGDYRVTLAQVNALRAKVDRRRAHIADLREQHPIPDFPAGTCE